jgi:hypothetical protein
MRNLKIGLAALVIALVAAVVIRQEQRAQRLQAEVNTLHARIAAAQSLQEENQRLVEQTRTAEEHASENLRELMRLRGLAHATQDVPKEPSHRGSGKQPPLDRSEVPKQQPYQYTPEQWSRFVETLNFGKKLGLALSKLAQANDGQMPTDLTSAGAWLATNAVPLAGDSTNGISEEDFELVYKRRLPELKDAEHTILAEEKEPVQITEGLWIRFYVFADGHVERVEATTRDGFAAREKELWPEQPEPSHP